MTEKAYALAKEAYAAWGVDTDQVIRRLAGVPISMHCWQGDDVAGFESPDGVLDGGIMATGNYPHKARTPEQLRQDAEAAFRLIPGRHRFNLHAIYLEAGGTPVERNAVEPRHFQGWIDWAKELGIGLDFNPTFFSHPLAADGFTLSHIDPGIRQFWIEHAICCRKIGAAMGAALGSPTVTNVWIPDGYKDIPVDRLSPRQRLLEALDTVFAEPLPPEHHLDAVESKLFGIGSESYVVGSHEFYMGYAGSRGKLLCLDAGHFHPTESIADKVTSTLLFIDRLLLHVSRGVRWDSDHVIVLNDDLRAIAEELVRHDFLDRVHIGLDFFDASINRVAAWVIGMRAMVKSLLLAMLEPTGALCELEAIGDLTARLAMLEEIKTLPVGAVWDHYCATQNVPVGREWLEVVRQYENDVIARR